MTTLTFNCDSWTERSHDRGQAGQIDRRLDIDILVTISPGARCTCSTGKVVRE